MCTSLKLYKDSFGRLVYGPCKTCIECRNLRREDFEQRLKFELMDYSYIGSFVSLTYRDDDLPLLLPEGSAIVGKWFANCPPAYGSTLYRPDITQFTDKMQKRLKRKFGVSGKYIAVGEYGDDSHRPHFHVIYVGLPSDSRKLVLDVWQHGNVDVGPINKGAIRYVLDYIDKQVYGPKALFDYYGDFEPPFAHFSKGLGFHWIENHLKDFDEYGCLKYESGKIIQLNPYLVEKFNFKKKPYSLFPESIKTFAQDKKIQDLNIAMIRRSKLMKTINEHKLINSGKGLVDTDKVEIESAKSRYFVKYGEEL